jgi:hypothetical protein
MPQYYDSRGTAGTPVTPQTQGIAPATSLTNVSAVSSGTALDGLSLRSTVAMVLNSSAGVSAGSVQLQGSLDNVNWYNLGTAVSTTTASTVFAPVVVSATAARYARASVVTAITGGTISATVAVSG